ncbi:MAG: ribokinase [Bacteroidaceae bacterium]|nr:ribokinase [Bacteroidaceae bacterium]
MKKICCIGHITLDKIVNARGVTYLHGGTAYYFAHGISHLPDTRFQLVTSLAPAQMEAVEAMRDKGLDVKVFPSRETVYFENTYSADQNHRTQRVLHKADPFREEYLADLHADYFHLGSLLADDFSVPFIQQLSAKGRVSLDVQGMLRRVEGTRVVPCDWAEKAEVLPYVDILKVNEQEMTVLTGETDVLAAARRLAAWGVREVVITQGSMGSHIYKEGQLIAIPAYPPHPLVDATGCGDTYMTGYLYQRARGADCQQAGRFAAAMSTIKLQHYGPFEGSIEEVVERGQFLQSLRLVQAAKPSGESSVESLEFSRNLETSKLREFENPRTRKVEASKSRKVKPPKPTKITTPK